MPISNSFWSWIRMSKDWGKFQFVVIEYASGDGEAGTMRAQFERVMDAVEFCAIKNKKVSK